MPVIPSISELVNFGLQEATQPAFQSACTEFWILASGSFPVCLPVYLPSSLPAQKFEFWLQGASSACLPVRKHGILKFGFRELPSLLFSLPVRNFEVWLQGASQPAFQSTHARNFEVWLQLELPILPSSPPTRNFEVWLSWSFPACLLVWHARNPNKFRL